MEIKNTNSGREAPDWRELFLASLPREQITDKYLPRSDQLEVFLNGKNGKEYRINAEMHERYGFMALVQSFQHGKRANSKWEVYAGKGKLMVFNAYPIKDELKKRGYRWNTAHKAWYREIPPSEVKMYITEIIDVLKLKGVI